MADDTKLSDFDTGTLTLAQRRALVKLIKGPFVSASNSADAEDFHVISASRQEIASQLDNLFLTLIVDDTAGIAYTKVWDTDLEGMRKLLRAKPLNFVETITILHLRRQLAKANPNERTIVDKTEVFEATAPYQTAQGTDHTKQAKNFDSAWNNLVKSKVVAPTPTPNRFEVSQVLRVVFSSDEIKAVTRSFEEMLEETDE